MRCQWRHVHAAAVLSFCLLGSTARSHAEDFRGSRSGRNWQNGYRRSRNRQERARGGRMGDCRDNRPADQIRQDRRDRRQRTLRHPRSACGEIQGWVRGYGLVDSAKIDGVPGQHLALSATIAPNEKAAAQYLSRHVLVFSSQYSGGRSIPGHRSEGNGVPEFMKNQGNWIDLVKNTCQSCHALGSDNIRSPHVKELGDFQNSVEMWTRRIQSGQAMSRMASGMSRIGPDLGLKLFADWTDRIAAGELPREKPSRPTRPRTQHGGHRMGLGVAHPLHA